MYRLIGVTPSNLRTMPWDEVRKICVDYTQTGLDSMAQLPRDSAGRPLRFIYTSGAKSERDPSKKPWVLGDYCLLRVKPFLTPSPFLPASISLPPR